MASSGSSGRATNSGSKGFDFASDDILCSYEDYGNQDANNGTHSDPSVAPNPAKEFNKSRMARSSGFPSGTYNPPEESSFHQDVILTVENTMKKYTDNLMRFLEGISSRLSQLELYCYNLDKSIGEMRSDLVRDHGESESKLKTLEKHIQEVHRSVQILRDKQELSDTQKELAKLQLAQKESGTNTPKNDERASPHAPPEPKKSDTSSEVHDQQLALALPHQIPPPHQPPHQQQQPPMAPPPSSIPPQQVQAYYLPPQPQMTNIPPQPQQSQPQYQIQDHSRMTPPPPQPQPQPQPQSQSHANPTPPQSLPPQYQQWAPQQPTQQPLMQQPQIRTSSQMVYSSYNMPPPGQPNPSPSEMAPNSMPMQVSFVGSPQTGFQQHLKPGYGPQSGDGYMPGGPVPRPTLAPGNAYMMFDGEGGRTTHQHQQHQQPHFQQSGYPPNNSTPGPQRIMPSTNTNAGNMRGAHPYNELIEKLVSMGYRGEHVVGIIQRLEESGQPIDFNSVLDRLNGHPSGGGAQRGGWSG